MPAIQFLGSRGKAAKDLETSLSLGYMRLSQTTIKILKWGRGGTVSKNSLRAGTLNLQIASFKGLCED